MRKLSAIAVFLSFLLLVEQSIGSLSERPLAAQSPGVAGQDQETKKAVIPIRQDAYLVSDNEQGFGSDSLMVGLSDTLKHTTFLQFSPPPLEPGATVVTASLRLYCRSTVLGMANEGLFELSTLDGPWSEMGLTHSNRPDSVEPRSDWEMSCEEPGWNVLEGPEFTEMVRQLLDSQTESHGWELRAKPSQEAVRLQLDSKETSGGGFPLGAGPMLEIEYIPGPNPVPTQGGVTATPAITVSPTAVVSPTSVPSATVSASPTATLVGTDTPTPASTPAPGQSQIFLPITLSNLEIGAEEPPAPIELRVPKSLAR